jgi:hypothetical protein
MKLKAVLSLHILIDFNFYSQLSLLTLYSFFLPQNVFNRGKMMEGIFFKIEIFERACF